MLYIITGNDTEKGRAKLSALRATLEKKRPEAAVFVVDDESFDMSRMAELIGGQGLFDEKYIVILDRVLGHPEATDFLTKHAEVIAGAVHVFILYAEKIDAKAKKKLEKHAQDVFVYEKKKGVASEIYDEYGAMCAVFNPFHLADAVAARDKKRAWTLFQQASLCELPMEEIHGIVAWQVRAILAASRAKSAEEAGLKPFVYGKAKRAAERFSDTDITTLSSSLVSVYHEGHGGGMPLKEGLEQWILTNI
jgi:DNA polymerase III delta subunit